jgi:type I restriction enzyme, S subunit
MKSWGNVPLSDISVRITKGTTPTTLGRPFRNSGVNFIKAEALNGDCDLDENGFSYIDEDTNHLLKRSILQEHDVLVTIAGAKIGKCGYLKSKYLPANTNQAVAIVRVDINKAVPKYVYYFFKNTKTFTYIQSLNAQAAQPNINLKMLGKINLKLPSYSVQEKIVDCLSAYDDLIENNRRRIQLLEQSARLLYKEWFVRLRFPGHERVKIKDGVPEGWEEKTVADLCSYLNRGITPKYNDSAVGVVVNQKCIRDRLINLEPARRQSKEVPQKKLLRFGDVLVNSTGEGTIGRIAQVTFDVDNCTADSHITIVRPANDVPIYYFGLFLTGLESFLSTMGRGATNQTELARSTIGEIRILLPLSALSEEFEDIVSPVYQLINRTVLQNKKLAEARDLLLPRLMNGEIEV